MTEYRAYSREELAQMPFGEVVDYINELWDEIVELKRALEGYHNKLDKKEDYIGRLQMQITDMQEEIQKLKAELNSPIGYLDLDSLDKQNELERLKNLLKGKDYTIEQQLKIIDCYRKEIDNQKEEIRELKEKLDKDEPDTIGYAPVNFVLEDSNSSYSEYAKHLMRKYEALTDSGFSHDDAMSLIPLWDDADFEEFKKGN